MDAVEQLSLQSFPLRARRLIPPLTLRQPDGSEIRAWDFKQKKNLVVVFLDEHCLQCEAFIRDVAARAAELREKEAVVLLAFPQEPGQSLRAFASDPLFPGATTPHHVRAFLGENALSLEGLSRRGTFVTDRYGEIADLWITRGHCFPHTDQILSSLNRVEIACEECEVPFWPVDE